MTRINPISVKQEICPQCKAMLSNINNTQLYCVNCSYAPGLLEQQLRVVPESYRSNAEHCLPANMKKVRQYLLKFASMCGYSVGESDLKVLTAEVMCLYKQMKRRGYEEIAAAIIYRHFKDNHSMTPREFCERGGIKQKKFNKFYIELVASNKAQKEQKPKEEDIQTATFRDQDSIKREVHKFISAIYDSIFGSPYLKSVREAVIEELAGKVSVLKERVEEIAYDQYSSVSVSSHQSTLYLTFALIKKIYGKLSYQKYKKAVSQELGITLSSKPCLKYKQSLNKILSHERTPSIAVTSITLQEKLQESDSI